jgi:hypothetical protein
MWLSSWLRNRRSNPARDRDGFQIRPTAPRFRPRLEPLEGRYLLSTLTVLNNLDSGPGSLRAEIAADSKDTIVFDSSLAGQTINLTSGELVIDKSLDIEGPGGNQLPVTVGSNGTSRIFDVTNPSSTVTLAYLIVFGGVATQGGAINDIGATVNLVHDNISGLAQGVIGSTSGPGGDARGGVIYQEGGAVNLSACSLNGTAQGGDGFGSPGAGLGGAIYTVGGTLTVTGSRIEGIAQGIGGTSIAAGGAIYSADASVTIANSTIFDSLALGANGLGGGIYASGGTLLVTNSNFTLDEAQTNLGGTAAGGAIYATGATVTVSNSLLFANACMFGDANLGGGIYLGGGNLTLTNDTFLGDVAIDPGLSGSTGIGGAVYIASGNACISKNTTFTNDFATTSNPDVFGIYTIC